LTALKEANWPNPVLSSASATKSKITGATGVKMSGPYSWEPPNYWLTDTSQAGGAFGFLTEGGPGQNPLSIESFNLTIPANKFWPINDYWAWHCGSQVGNFGNLGYFTTALYARFGNVVDSAEDFLEKSQVMAYEAHRAMFEAYGRNKYTATGVIQWMLNNAFPEMIWHLYDYYWNPSSAYFATKRACEPVHIQYSYDDRSVWIVNSFYVPQENLVATAQVYNLDGKLVYHQTVPVVKVDPDSSISLFSIPNLGMLTSTYFVRLLLTDSKSVEISNNFYWLSTTQDVLNWSKTSWFATPCSSFADYTLLSTLGRVNLQVQSNTKQDKMDSVTQVTINNPGTVVAFFIHARVLGINERDVWPIFWDDNYVTLLPGETRVLTARYAGAGDGNQVTVDVWNNISGKKNA